MKNRILLKTYHALLVLASSYQNLRNKLRRMGSIMELGGATGVSPGHLGGGGWGIFRDGRGVYRSTVHNVEFLQYYTLRIRPESYKFGTKQKGIERTF